MDRSVRSYIREILERLDMYRDRIEKLEIEMSRWKDIPYEETISYEEPPDRLQRKPFSKREYVLIEIWNILKKSHPTGMTFDEIARARASGYVTTTKHVKELRRRGYARVSEYGRRKFKIYPILEEGKIRGEGG